MKTYQVIIKQLGTIIEKVEGITALNSLKAIEAVESQYQRKDCQLSDKNGQVKNFSWTMLEFEARQVNNNGSVYTG